ncbi:3-methyladenine DNA glycosylase [Ruania alkalisoli]|uniref:3-methyladenine DNA glycosylase n=1 Tax=Ruania alkalisoli TaxID=2779775 RepID=A0A7M1SQW5_9MICO|nr:3-methyladenine DNA glycosylase [Ruania alkalisoli]QOR69527.1 3-methyladenine DNA glycosylase [Ruania alkalisoli]
MTTVLTPTQWHPLAEAHAERADALTRDYRERRQAQQRHPVEDFLFTYYPTKPAQLRIWHPGAGRALAEAPEHARRRWYSSRDGAVTLNERAFLAERGDAVRFVHDLVSRTRARPARLSCFGLHEWAMVYRTEEVRHAQVPLRLGAAGTDEVVRSHSLRCTHFDAFRFFTVPAIPRNERRLTRTDQAALEQPGCLHANMDVYKWAMKLGPAVPGELLLDAFALARDIRALDMRASPYDLRDWGYEPVPIETADGKATYVAAQREFAERANRLRDRVLEVTSSLLRTAATTPG